VTALSFNLRNTMGCVLLKATGILDYAGFEIAIFVVLNLS
jgi:hypothetical protein